MLSVAGVERELSPEEATALRSALGEAVAERRSFVHTAGERRPDGSYAVHRRGADSTGNTVVFDSFRALCRLYERLPATIDAECVGEEGFTGSRRHLIVRHLAEHPAFDCRVDSRSPLRVQPTGEGSDETRASDGGDRTGEGDTVGGGGTVSAGPASGESDD